MKSARAFLCLLPLLVASSAQAAVISITSEDVGNVSFDLSTTYGTTDWAYWAQTAAVTAPAAPTNEKFNPNFISSITAVAGTGVRGSSAAAKPQYDFAFTDGTSTVSGSVSDIIGLFNQSLGSGGNDTGVQLNVTAPSADPFVIYVWGTSFQSTGNLTATIGAATDTDSTMVHGAVRTPGKLYTIAVTPDSAGQNVNVQMIHNGSTDANSNASISAVAVVVPEPSTLAIVAVGSLALALRRPRSRN